MTQNADYRDTYRRTLRQIRRRDWIANNVPLIGPLMFKFWLRRSR